MIFWEIFYPCSKNFPSSPKKVQCAGTVSRRVPDLLGILASGLATGECQDWGLRVFLLTDSSVQHGRDTGHVGTHCCGEEEQDGSLGQ